MKQNLEFPKTIKGTTQSYGIIEKGKTEADYPNCLIEVPIDDIQSFELVHETFKNGLQLRANIKPELVDRWNRGLGEYGDWEKRKYTKSWFTIRTKDEPKLSKQLRKILMESKTIIVHSGINAGTPIAQSYTYGKKELTIEKIQESSQGVSNG